jgi:hypothetical protein
VSDDVTKSWQALPALHLHGHGTRLAHPAASVLVGRGWDRNPEAGDSKPESVAFLFHVPGITQRTLTLPGHHTTRAYSYVVKWGGVLFRLRRAVGPARARHGRRLT